MVLQRATSTSSSTEGIYHLRRFPRGVFRICPGTVVNRRIQIQNHANQPTPTVTQFWVKWNSKTNVFFVPNPPTPLLVHQATNDQQTVFSQNHNHRHPQYVLSLRYENCCLGFEKQKVRSRFILLGKSLQCIVVSNKRTSTKSKI